MDEEKVKCNPEQEATETLIQCETDLARGGNCLSCSTLGKDDEIGHKFARHINDKRLQKLLEKHLFAYFCENELK